MNIPIKILIHGGAGTILKKDLTDIKEQEYLTALKTASDLGYMALADGLSSIEAVNIAIISLENNALFNAGKGSVFTAEGKHEMDAAIMCGKTLNAGAVAMVSGIKNPINLAKLVMEQSPHVFLASSGAMAFANAMGIPILENDYFYDEYRYQQWQEIKNTDEFTLDHQTKKEGKFGTVGAVALDLHGNIAAGTSTGGMTNKKFGRIGDSPIIGAGTYANNKTCAISCTGSGEFFMRAVVAYDISCLIEYKAMDLQTACDFVIKDKLVKQNGDGGLIGINNKGESAFSFNTEGMYRAIRSENHQELAIYK